MSSTPNTPGETTTTYIETAASSLPRWVTLLFVVAFALVAYLLYAGYADRQAARKGMDDAERKTQALATELDKTNSRIADLKGQLDVTSQKLGLTQDELAQARSLAQTIKKDQQKSDAKLRSEIAGVQSGLIARNHDEVEELKRRGERDIFEFDLTKSNAGPQHVGPIQVQLKKVDTKHYRYTVNVVADDKTIEKKDKTVGEPIQFYVKGARAPYEIVVFDLSKDQAKGYLSTPKSAGAAPPASPAPGN